MKLITIGEDKYNDSFKYRAQIETIDGKQIHLVLPNVENFLAKLDLAQREMGKMPNDFVPVRYASSTEGEGSPIMNFAIGGLFLLLLLQIYRSMHGKGPGSGGQTGAGKGTGS